MSLRVHCLSITIVFLADLTVLWLITIVGPRIWENSYLPKFSAEVSQIVFFADLTVVRLIRTVWPKISENSYLCEFTAQVAQIAFLADLNVLRLITSVLVKFQKTYISGSSVPNCYKSKSKYFGNSWQWHILFKMRRRSGMEKRNLATISICGVTSISLSKSCPPKCSEKSEL